MMRRFIALAIGVVVLVGLAAPAGALQGPKERYDTVGLDAFWHFTQRLDRTTYLQTTWYAGAYLSEERGQRSFWSDLYKDVERCEERQGRDRCRTASYWVGVIDELGGSDSFSVDRKLTTGELVATYRLRERDRDGWTGEHRMVTVTATLAGTGPIERSQYSEEEWEGHCLVWGYDNRYVRREAVARGSLSGDVAKGLGRTRDSSVSTGKTAVAEGDC